MTVQMNSNSGISGSVKLPAPSGAVVSLTNGIGAVNAADVPVALQAGWSVQVGETWPGKAVKHLSVPVGGAWPTSGTLTLPDGSTVTITAGTALIPIAWANWAIGLGWYATPVVSWGE